MARQSGTKVEIITSHPDPGDSITDKTIVSQAVLSWMAGISAALKSPVTEDITWNDDPDGTYVTDRPDWLGYLMAMAHVERARLS
uniref:Uncharacterized protein n=1 Tax=Citrifermentans bremense TaxID=60035 RepID=A0A6S6MBA5_9BACT